MLFRDVIELVSVTYTENDIGDSIEVVSNRQVFANKKSVRQTEFYQAAQTGLKPELMFEIRTTEYQDEEKLSYNGKEYTIIRSYDKNGEFTELICSGLVGA
jgi:SPP1 family predicted phage head-tail adaptor